jgi:transcriptional regulator GlxA family with amidase domain
MRNVAIVLYEGVELLDFAGPGEVFAAAARIGAVRGQPAFRVYTVATSKAPLTSQGFLKVTPDYSIDDAPRSDLIVVPGGNSGTLSDDSRFMAWARKAIDDAEVSMSVCTGAFVLGKAGALDGRTATTWFGATEKLRQTFPKATVQDGRRFVDEGRVVTTAGVSAGIDGALHVVARLLGRAVADRTARYMEYHWTPEAYLAQKYSLLNPSLDERGRALQRAAMLEDEKSWAEAAKAYKALADQDPKEGYAWHRLAVALFYSGDTKGAVAAGKKAAGFAEVRPDVLVNLACFYARAGQRNDALSALEDAVASGFTAKWRLQGDDDLASVRDDPRFQKLLARL